MRRALDPTPESPRESAPVARASVSLRTKLVALALVVSVPPLAFVGWKLVDVNEETLSRSCRELQVAVAEDVALTVDRELGDSEDALDSVGRALTDTRQAADVREASARSIVEGNAAIDHASIYGADGILIDTIRERVALGIQTPALLPRPIRERAVRDNAATGEVAIREELPRVLIVVPLRAGERVTGFAASMVSLAPVQARVQRLADAHYAETSDAIYIVDERSHIIAHSDPERASRLANAPQIGLLEGLRDAHQGRVLRSGEYADPRSGPMVGTVVGVEARGWAVVAQVPVAVAYAPIRRARVVVLGTVLGAIALAVLLGLVLASRITSPLRALVAFSRDLAARRFDRRVAVSTRDELAVLARAMSDAARELETSEARIREESAIRADLRRYLPGEVVDKVVRREQDMGLGGHRAEITVLFADVVAFTPLTERLAPEATVTILNELFTILTQIVFRHGGMVDKFVGDCVMALFGAPGPSEPPGHAARALAAAEDMLRWLEAGNATWQERFGVTVQLAIGINTGEVILGNVGSEQRMEYTAIGDVVNVAARLEAVARPQQILVTRATRDAAGDAFTFVDLGDKTLSGRAEPVHLYEVRP